MSYHEKKNKVVSMLKLKNLKIDDQKHQEVFNINI